MINGQPYTSFFYNADPDPRYEHLLQARVDSEGTLTFNVAAGSNRQTYGTGTDMFISMMNRCVQDGLEIKKIRAIWEIYEPDGTNMKEYSSNLHAGFTKENAARNTWTGRRAAQYGYTDVDVSIVGAEIFADFTKPVAADAVR